RLAREKGRNLLERYENQKKKKVEKANPYHDERGRFTSANSATGGRSGGGIRRGKAKGKPKSQLDDTADSVQRRINQLVDESQKLSAKTYDDYEDAKIWAGKAYELSDEFEYSAKQWKDKDIAAVYLQASTLVDRLIENVNTRLSQQSSKPVKMRTASQARTARRKTNRSSAKRIRRAEKKRNLDRFD
ncbi:MAG: hypothetical protein EBU84_17405, partial [Actinobacteria bacterium]|nr:hypothetical protein [Actinomycetota bacterium]